MSSIISPNQQKRTCNMCGVEKTLEAFKFRDRSKNKREKRCRKCQAERRLELMNARTPIHIEKKRCYRCGIEKSCFDFTSRKSNADGLHNFCRECSRDVDRQRAENRIHPYIETKLCGNCKLEKHRSEFNREKRRLYGLSLWCKSCISQRTKRERQTPEGKERQRLANARPENVERRRRYMEKILQDPKYLAGRREYSKRYSQTPEGKLRSRIGSHKRRALKRQNGGGYTTEDVDLMMKSQKGKCWYCQKDITKKYEIEHRVPLSRGGTNYPSNLVLACPKCNRKKYNKLPHEWNGRLL